MKSTNEYVKLYRLLSRREKRNAIILLIMMIGVAFFEVVGIGVIPAFISTLGNIESINKYPIIRDIIDLGSPEAEKNVLLFGSALLVLVFILKNTYFVIYYYYETKYSNNRRYMLSHKLMSAYLKAPYKLYLQRNTSELIRNVTTEVNLTVNNVLTPLLVIAKNSISAVAILGFLVAMEPLITLFVFLGIGSISYLFLLITQKKLRMYGAEAQETRKNLIQVSQEAYGGIKLAKVLNKEDYFTERFRLTASRLAKLTQMAKYTSQIPKPVVEVFAVIGLVSISIYLYNTGSQITALVPTITLFGISIVRLMPIVQQITQMITSIRYNKAAINPIYNDIEKYGNMQYDASDVKHLKKEIKSIDIKSLYYMYDDTNIYTLKNISLTINKGDTIAFVGYSGSGKTTLINIILGLLKPTDGSVKINESQLEHVKHQWQKCIGYIPQEVYLLDDTIRSNISFAQHSSEIDEDRVQKVVRMAQLDQMIKELPLGLDTVIGEHGTRLSGGQRQRIGIARALYVKPSVLIMDEATSALDTITEQTIVNNIMKEPEQIIKIIVAHRISTIQGCDRIIMMKNGSIANQGTYNELLQNSIEFKKLVEADNRETD